MRKFSILIVDEDKETRDLLSGLLKRKDRTLIQTPCTGEAETIISGLTVDMIISTRERESAAE